MSLGNLLLQPQRLQRVSADTEVAVVQDLLRLLTLLAEDAAAEGPLAAALPQVVTRLGDRVQAQAAAGAAGVYDALKGGFQPLFLYFEDLVRDLESLDQDPAALLGMIRQLIAGLRTLLDSTTQAGIKAQLDFVKGLIEQNLGLDRDFVGRQIGAMLDDVVDVWRQLPADISPARRRRRRLAIQAVRRLRRQLLDRFELPEIDTARAASRLYQLLRGSGIRRIFEEIGCVLDKFDQAVAAAQDIGAALPIGGPGGGSLGAALVDLPNATNYCWYASWLLSDVDLPLLGVDDIEDKKAFVNVFRTHQGATVKAGTVTRFFYSELSVEQQHQVIDYDGVSEPDEGLVRMLVAHINQFMMHGPIYTASRFSTPHANQDPDMPVTAPFEFRLLAFESMDPEVHFTEELRDLRNDYREDQTLFLYNRRFLEWAYGDLIDSLCNGFWRYVERKTIGIGRDVIVTGDKRYVMCNDIPIHVADPETEAKWEDSLLFIDKDSGRHAVEGATYWHFTRVSALACDILAQVLQGLVQTAKPIWHLVDLQPGHEIGTGIVAGLDILHALHELLFFKPITGYESLGAWGRWLDSSLYGPRALAMFGGSFQGMHTDATAGNGFWFWVTVILGDIIRISGHGTIPSTVRDATLSFFTLLNSSASNSGDSSLPSNPAANHLKQGGITSPMNSLFAYLLMLVYKRENHSIEIWSAANIGDRREHAFGLWFGGCAGFGVLAGLSGSIVSQFIAWQEDWKLLGITIGESAAYLFLLYWFFEYFFKEGDTADGTYALTGSYKGYPAKANSPYRLPAEAGTALYMGQGNNGLFSHNEITNIGSNWQVYAFDLGFDHRQIVRAMRGGVVWSFDDSHPDNNESDANFIIIRHTTTVDDHDDPYGTGTPVMTFARYWHGAENGVTNVLGASPVGMTINQGDPIMEADDTGTSFHSHLHIYVTTGDMSGPDGESIPIVFEDVDNDEGLMSFLTWYRAGG